MNDFKKNPIFYSVITLLAGLFLAGIWFVYSLSSAQAASAKKLTMEVNKYRNLIAGYKFIPEANPVSLTPVNVESARSDKNELINHQAKLRMAISGPQELRILGKEKITNTELVALMKQSVDEWTKSANDQGIRLLTGENKCDFGFRRYIRNAGSSPRGKFAKIDQQRLIIDFLYKLLADSRSEAGGATRTPLLLISIDREPIEILEANPTGEVPRFEADEFTPTRSFRQDKYVETLSFRIKFVSQTSTLRTFLNKLHDIGRPFAITTIEVNTPTPEVVKSLGGNVLIDSAASATPTAVPAFFMDATLANSSPGTTPAAPERKVVMRQSPSEFTIQLDYLFAPEDKPATTGETKK
jgi:hypothetical protein